MARAANWNILLSFPRIGPDSLALGELEVVLAGKRVYPLSFPWFDFGLQKSRSEVYLRQ